MVKYTRYMYFYGGMVWRMVEVDRIMKENLRPSHLPTQSSTASLVCLYEPQNTCCEFIQHEGFIPSEQTESTEMTTFRDRLHDLSRPQLFGTCILSPSPHFLQAARATSLDFVFLDTEHVPLDRHQLSWMCRAYDAAGIAPIVRVPSVLDASGSVTSVLDGGAVGVVSPYTETLDQVLALVGMSKLRPLKGSTLQLALGILKQQAHKNHALAEQSTVASTPGYVDPLPFLSELLPVETLACMRKENDGTVLFLNIESTLGMSNLSLLLSVPGVDGVFVGPKDLSVQLGVPEQWESDTFVNACDTIVKITVRRGLSVGNHYSFDHAVEYQNHWRTLGANLVVHSTDMKLFQNALLADFKQLRGDRTRGEGGGTAVADV